VVVGGEVRERTKTHLVIQRIGVGYGKILRYLEIYIWWLTDLEVTCPSDSKLTRIFVASGSIQWEMCAELETHITMHVFNSNLQSGRDMPTLT
jgi:hypothetical protein